MFTMVTTSVYMVLLVLMPVYDAHLVRKRKREVEMQRKGKETGATSGGAMHRRRRKLRSIVRELDSILCRTRAAEGDEAEIKSSKSPSAVISHIRTRLSQFPELRGKYAERRVLSMLAEAMPQLSMPMERANAVHAARLLLGGYETDSPAVDRAMHEVSMTIVRMPRDPALTRAAAAFYLAAQGGNHEAALRKDPSILDHLFVMLHTFATEPFVAREISAAIGKLMDKHSVSIERIGAGECVNCVEIAQKILRRFKDDEDTCGHVARWAWLVTQLPEASAAVQLAVGNNLYDDVAAAMDQFPNSRRLAHFGKRLLRVVQPPTAHDD